MGRAFSHLNIPEYIHILIRSKKFPHFKQADAKDCGPTCIKIIAKFHGIDLDLSLLRKISETTREGSNLMLLSETCEHFGFKTLGVRLSMLKLLEAPLPCIIHWNKLHYVVLYKIKKGKFFISDPAHGLIEYTEDDFLKFWIGNNSTSNTPEGIALLLQPKSSFFNNHHDEGEHKQQLFAFVLKYIVPYKAYVFQLIFGLSVATILQLALPFLTQAVVDIGVREKDVNFIYLILICQLCIFVGKAVLEIIRGWTMLHLSTRINISMISDFFVKLMSLPISYFDVRMTGDIFQRISDHGRIERVITTSSLSMIFALLNMIVLSTVLAYYNTLIFMVFVVGSVAYFIWIKIFMKKRSVLDYKRFTETSRENSKVIEMINGIQDIKLHNAERKKRWEWEHIQSRIFKISIKSLSLEQVQSTGSALINELKNIIIIFISAALVIRGEITLGMMMAISTIVGSLNAPVAQLILFFRELQDAKISLVRLGEIHKMESEPSRKEGNMVDTNQPIRLRNISFKYQGASEYVLQNLTVTIPPKKITAIVGASGSGKTTLLKILLKFYDPASGTVSIGNMSFDSIAPEEWRSKIGVVMQEGYIFNDTLANNIAVGVDDINRNQLEYAARVANISEYIESLPLGYNTVVGIEGTGMSTGQKQRILIARAVYKNPDILLFDEATSALDANNEMEIMTHLNAFLKDKTAIIIAHRLSTVVNADQILVLENGDIIEHGTHNDLIALEGKYFGLIKNQLELGN